MEYGLIDRDRVRKWRVIEYRHRILARAHLHKTQKKYGSVSKEKIRVLLGDPEPGWNPHVAIDWCRSFPQVPFGSGVSDRSLKCTLESLIDLGNARGRAFACLLWIQQQSPGLNPATIRKSLKFLEKQGLISRIYQVSYGHFVYKINVGAQPK